MKKIIAILLVILCLTNNQKVLSQVGVSVDINTFNTALSPYGRWVDYPQYGRIWICNEPGFRPYYNDGHWEYTEDGWTWISDYPWGWAPFHYGRWAYTNDYGWGWVPGYDWAPAWVSWSSEGDYYGWAPLGPGFGIDVSIGSIPAERWCFVPHQYINSRSIHNYYVPSSRNEVIYRNASVINNIHASHNVSYIAGPRRSDVERVAHIKIQTRVINYSQRPGRTVVSNNAINIYRPGAIKNNAASNSNRNASAGGRTINNNTNRNNTIPTNASHTNNANRTRSTQNNQHPVQQPQASQQRQPRVRTQQLQRVNHQVQNNQRSNQQQQPRVRAQQPQRVNPQFQNNQRPNQQQQQPRVRTQQQPQQQIRPMPQNRPAQNDQHQPERNEGGGNGEHQRRE